jgi:hypothetical protein
MKKTLISIALAAFMMNGCAENHNECENKVTIPDVVKNAFATQYPQVKHVKWSIEKPGEYEAEFETGWFFNEKDISVNIDTAGNILVTETEIKKSDLPQPIIATLEKDFAGYKIHEVEKADSKGVITYELEAKNKKEHKKLGLVFDETGKLIKQEDKNAEKEEEEAREHVKAPEAVLNTFAAKFPTVVTVKWSIEKPGEYEGEFAIGSVINKTEMSVLIDEKGELLLTESAIKISDLPQAIKLTIEKDFMGYEIEDVEKADTKGIITFEMKAKKDNNVNELVFDESGKLIKKEEINAEEKKRCCKEGKKECSKEGKKHKEGKEDKEDND